MFSKKPAPMAPSTPARPVAGGSTFSVFGADVSVKGDITASVDLHVDGQVDGDITCASLVQGVDSEIVGIIRADSARLSGRVQGSISARDLVILKSARIEGDVYYEALTIEQGAVVEGQFAQRSPDMPQSKAVAQQGDEPALSLAKGA